ncbi:hypothetical protein [Acetobacterium sp.]|uniref:hypothetical protein n=1 Tax=Acetobacterium sp. TaxID=1872094 RepID=UPI002F414B81
MANIKFIRWLLAILFFFGLVFLVPGCSNTTTTEKSVNNDPLNFYNKIQLSELKSEVDAALGVVPEEKDGTFTYTDKSTGFGIIVSYDSGNSVIMKTLYTADESEIMALSNAKVTEDQLASITKGMTYEEVKGILGGEGIEIISMANPMDKNNPINVMIWFNDDETGFYVTFIGDKGTVQSVKYWK